MVGIVIINEFDKLEKALKQSGPEILFGSSVVTPYASQVFLN
jgi:hypothetical protein